MFIFINSVDVGNVTFIDEKWRIGGKNELCIQISAFFLKKESEFFLDLWVKMEFWFVDDEKSAFEIVAIERENDHEKRFFSATELAKIDWSFALVEEGEGNGVVDVFDEEFFSEKTLDGGR